MNIEIKLRKYIIDGDIETLQSILSEHPKYIRERWCLERAVNYDRLEIVKYLLKSGARTYPSLLLDSKSLEMTKYLVDNCGVNINIYREFDGHTPLHNAAARGDLETVKYLIEKGAHIDVIDDIGWTPLMFAAGRHDSYELVKYLIEKNAKWYRITDCMVFNKLLENEKII